MKKKETKYRSARDVGWIFLGWNETVTVPIRYCRKAEERVKGAEAVI